MTKKKEQKYPSLRSVSYKLTLDDGQCHAYKNGLSLASDSENANQLLSTDDKVYTFETHPFYKKIGSYDCEMPDTFKPSPELGRGAKQ
ncbi:hypothetical protein D210916BOD24_00380 [Alteromonas sp. D210916BOD_24]|uniref:hypothetical protein n=1 Tax=Alteromonas sp. D210916BOD_24 TaxID=3157618 RepID=UPI00399D1D1C